MTTRKGLAVYALAAAAIWSLVLYSLVSHPQPQRTSMAALKLCVQQP